MKSKDKISELIKALDNFHAVNTKAEKMAKAIKASGCEVSLDFGQTNLAGSSNCDIRIHLLSNTELNSLDDNAIKAILKSRAEVICKEIFNAGFQYPSSFFCEKPFHVYSFGWSETYRWLRVTTFISELKTLTPDVIFAVDKTRAIYAVLFNACWDALGGPLAKTSKKAHSI